MRRVIPLAILAAVLVSGGVQAQETLYVTVTHYADSGVTYSGGRTYVGMAACSWNIPLGAVIRFADGREYTCLDRGQLGSAGWVDIYVPDVQTARQLGRYSATVEVLR